MPTVRGVPLKRPAFAGEGWKAAATDAKQMRLTPVAGLALVHDRLPVERQPVFTTPRTIPQDNQEWAGIIDEVMAEASASPTVVNLVPVVKLDMRVIFHGAAVACSLSITNVNAVLAAAPELVARRNRYTAGQIGSLVSAHARIGDSLRHTVRNINNVGGFGAVSGSMLCRWAQKEDDKAPARKRGVKAQVEFEKEVISELIYTSVAEVDTPAEARVVANVSYSYWVVASAARKVQAMPTWANDAKVQSLKFTNP